MLEDKSGKKDMAQSYLEKNETKVESNVGPSVWAFVTGKKYVTNMKSLEKKLVKINEFDSNGDGDLVTFAGSGGWSGQQVWRLMIPWVSNSIWFFWTWNVLCFVVESIITH